MIRSELVARIREEFPDLSERDAERAVRAIFDRITEGMAEGDRIELRGFGSFTPKQRPGHKGRNPRTGELVQVPPKRWPTFKASAIMRARLNPAKADPIE